MQHGSLFPDCGCEQSQSGRHGCCRPCCGYILEEIHSHRQECRCFHGLLEICGLPARLMPPLALCRIDVVCISPQCAQERSAFRLTLRCEVEDCCGCRACGDACISAELRVPACRGENLRLGAEIDVHSARFCAPSAFEVCADIILLVVTTGAGRMFKHQPCASRQCAFPPLYPAPICGRKE